MVCELCLASNRNPPAPKRNPQGLALKQERHRESQPIALRHESVPFLCVMDSWRCRLQLLSNTLAVWKRLKLSTAKTALIQSFLSTGRKYLGLGLISCGPLFCSATTIRARVLLGNPISKRQATENRALCVATLSPSCTYFCSFCLGVLRIPFSTITVSLDLGSC